MKTIMGPLFEPETPSKCFFEARGDVASPNEAGGIIVEAIIVPRPVTGRLPYMGASSRYIHKTTCTTEFKYSRFIFADHAPS